MSAGVKSYLRSGTPKSMTREEQIAILRKIVAHQKNLSVHELRNIATQIGMAEFKCLRWFNKHGITLVRQGNYISKNRAKPDPNFGFASLSVASNKISKSIKANLSRQRHTFFWKLPYHKQIALLKRTEGMTTTSVQVAQELADSLKLPLEKVKVWMKHRRRKQIWFRTNPKLTPEKMTLLRAEYNKNDNIDEDQALILSHLFSIPPKTVLHYFSNRRARLKYIQTKDNNGTQIPKSEAKEPEFIVQTKKIERVQMNNKKSRFFYPEQLTLLFEEFKRNPSPSSEKYNTLAETTGLKTLQIMSWFSKLRLRLNASTFESLSIAMKADWEPFQVKEFERIYQECKYLSDEKAQKLGDKFEISKKSVMHWFTRRRLYELYNHQHGKIDDGSSADLNADGSAEFGMFEELATASETDEKLRKRPKFFPSLTSAKNVKLLKEYNNKMRWDDIPKIAREMNVPESTVCTWFKNKTYKDSNHRKRKIIEGNQLKETKNESGSKGLGNQRKPVGRFSLEQLRILERKFAENDRIMKDEATELAKSSNFGGNITAAHIQNWYMNKRFRIRMMAKKEEMQPKTIFVSEQQKTGKETFDFQPVAKTAGPSQKSLLQNNILFIEYKKSQNLNASRLKDLSKKVRLNSDQIRRWFMNVNKRVSKKNIEDVAQILKHSLSVSQIKRLCHEYMKYRYCSYQRLELLAEQLKITRGIVQNWFINARYYELLTGDKFKLDFESAQESDVEHETTDIDDVSAQLKLGLTWPQIQELKKEFRKDENMTQQRAKELATVLKIRSDKIKNWFKNRKTLVSQNRENGISEPEDDTIDDEPGQNSDSVLDKMMSCGRSISVLIPKISQIESTKSKKYHKLPLQQDTLYEAFKQSPELTPVRLAQLCSRVHLTDKQITRWFSWMRKKLSSMSGEKLLESYRNRNLTPEQVNMLEAEFKCHPYIDQENRDELAHKLGLNRGTIKMWFANRRYFDIISHFNGGTKNFDYKVDKLSDDDQFEISVEIETESVNGRSESDTSAHLFELSDPLELDKSSDSDVPFQPVITSIVSVGKKTDIDDETVDIDSEYELIPPSIDVTAVKQEPFSDISIHEDSEEDLSNRAIEIVDNTDCTIIIPEPSDNTEYSHYIEPLNENLELTESKVNSVFWYACSNPSPQSSIANVQLSKTDKVVLEAIFENNPEPDLNKIHEIAQQLWVSDQTVYWWFVQKRFSLKIRSKENAAADFLKNSSAEDMNSTEIVDKDNDPKCTEVEFVALNEDELNQSAFVDESSLIQINGESVSDIEIMNSDGGVATSIGITPEKNPLSEEDHAVVLKHDLSKKRKVLSAHQRAILLQEFKKSPFVSTSKSHTLAADLGMSVNSVDQWFTRRRRTLETSANVDDIENENTAIEDLTSTQLTSLETEYSLDQRLTKVRLSRLVQTLHLRKRTILLWFRNRKEKDENEVV